MDMACSSIFETSVNKSCQEGLSCEQGARADVYCEECTTYQCAQCDALLHVTHNLKQHSRNSLHTQEKFSLTTESSCELWCSPRQTAVVYCQECHVDMCSECDSKIHQGRRRMGHARMELEEKNGKRGGAVVSRNESGYEKELPFSFLLVNEQEELMVHNADEFVRKLACAAQDKLKVVSIFGNTGDGKSHTLNHTFFEGEEVFSTSAHQSSCTIGVWTAYSHRYSAIFIDSEGLLGVSKNENQRTRLLLKVLAISDIIIYRTRAERLHNDLFTFLGDASEAYWKYFSPELKAASERCSLDVPLSSLGPSAIIFHETQYTELLGEGATGNSKSTSNSSSSTSPVKIQVTPEQTFNTEESPEESPPKYFKTRQDNELSQQNEEWRVDQLKRTKTHPMSAEELLRIRFSELGRIPKAFCSVEYIGTKTQTTPTDFSALRTAVSSLLSNNAVRSPRRPDVIFTALQVLNDKFSSGINDIRSHTFPDAYFTCAERCLSCSGRCDLSMNHLKDGVAHNISQGRCKYSHTFDNKIYLCKACFDRGVESVVTPTTTGTAESGWLGLAKYAWSGYVIECSNCGVIYRSRQHWYGNEEPEMVAVKTDNKHIWPQDISSGGQGSENAVRRLLDGVGSVAEVVSSVSAFPAKTVTSWMSDKIAPTYWTPNSKILVCGECHKEFESTETKHHCRACGGGFCDKCSSKYMAVPWRGWGNIPVKVCLSCYKNAQRQERHGTNEKSRTPTTGSEHNVRARYVGEAVQSAIGLVTGAISYPKGAIVESARPVYWVPDAKMKSCYKCKDEFGPSDSKHHCRACGEGFCGKCSSHQCPVPSRGWENPVRVCDLCVDRTDL